MFRDELVGNMYHPLLGESPEPSTETSKLNPPLNPPPLHPKPQTKKNSEQPNPQPLNPHGGGALPPLDCLRV
jgi:hypothetical protein